MTEPAPTSRPQPGPVVLPPTANVPAEWIRWSNLYHFGVAMPGWGTGPGSPPTYEVVVDRETRAMACQVKEGVPCRGFKFHGSCHHIRDMLRATCKPPRNLPDPSPGAREPTPAGAYPYTPGFRATDTSRAAAGAIESEADTLRGLAYDALQDAPDGLTADEVAGKLERDRLAIRPRVTELRKQGRIQDSGARRLNASGRGAIVWVVVP